MLYSSFLLYLLHILSDDVLKIKIICNMIYYLKYVNFFKRKLEYFLEFLILNIAILRDKMQKVQRQCY